MDAQLVQLQQQLLHHLGAARQNRHLHHHRGDVLPRQGNPRERVALPPRQIVHADTEANLLQAGVPQIGQQRLVRVVARRIQARVGAGWRCAPEEGQRLADGRRLPVGGRRLVAGAAFGQLWRVRWWLWWGSYSTWLGLKQ